MSKKNQENKTAFLQYLAEALDTAQISVGNREIKQIEDFISLLIKWNKTYNLTAICDPYDIVKRHILDSLSILPYIGGQRIIDIGTGAGFPGIPLAIVLPHFNFVLLDSKAKKTRFLTQVKTDLRLSNVSICNQRALDYKPEKTFNNVVTRAVTSLEGTIMMTKHLCADGGQFLMMKGKNPDREITSDIREKFHVDIIALNIIGLSEQRHLIKVRNRSYEKLT